MIANNNYCPSCNTKKWKPYFQVKIHGDYLYLTIEK